MNEGMVDGFGWSVNHDVAEPDQDLFMLESCLREADIRSIEGDFNRGQKVLVWGDDGFGKTTLLTEMNAYLRSQGRQVEVINHLVYRKQESLEYWISYLSHLDLESGQSRSVVLMDSMDYLWEATDDPVLGEVKNKLLRTVLELNNVDVVMTAHQHEPKGKRVDSAARDACLSVLDAATGNQQVVNRSLMPWYEPEKARLLFESFGCSEELARVLVSLGMDHATIKNYFAKRLDEQTVKTLNRLASSWRTGKDSFKALLYRCMVLPDKQQRWLDAATENF